MDLVGAPERDDGGRRRAAPRTPRSIAVPRARIDGSRAKKCLISRRIAWCGGWTGRRRMRAIERALRTRTRRADDPGSRSPRGRVEREPFDLAPAREGVTHDHPRKCLINGHEPRPDRVRVAAMHPCGGERRRTGLPLRDASRPALRRCASRRRRPCRRTRRPERGRTCGHRNCCRGGHRARAPGLEESRGHRCRGRHRGRD